MRSEDQGWEDGRLPVSISRILEELEVLGFQACSQSSPPGKDWMSVLGQAFPELDAMKGFRQNNPHHIYDVWQHTMAALSCAGDDRIVDFAILFHDAGKPRCYTEDQNGIGHFYGHGEASAGIASAALEQLGADEDMIQKVVQLVRYHDVYLHGKHKSVKRWLGRLGGQQFRRLVEVKRCDAMAQEPEYLAEKLRRLDRILEIFDEVTAQSGQLEVKDLAVDGRDLMEQGYKPGRLLGETLGRLRDCVSDGTVPNRKEELMSEAGRRLGEQLEAE